MAIHKTAIIDRRAEIDSRAEIGPYVVVEGKVSIAAGTVVMAHAFITGNTAIGPDNVIHPFAVIGHAPQDLSYRGEESFLKIGRGNTFREGCSIHRGSRAGTSTVIGDGSFFMGFSHVGHDCVVGNGVILANGSLVAGHARIFDKANISGNAAIHQFVRIGEFAILGGLARATKDVPPYMMVGDGMDSVCGINVIGLRRAGFDEAARARIKRVYKILYRSGLNVTQAVEAIEKEDLGEPGRRIVEFIRDSQRGISGHA